MTRPSLARARRKHRKAGRPAEVSLVEGDIVCATTVLNFCSNLERGCHHVSTIPEAEAFLRGNAMGLGVVILDHFIRVDPRGDRRTGADWLAELTEEFPEARRRFGIVVISGHTELESAVAASFAPAPGARDELLYAQSVDTVLALHGSLATVSGDDGQTRLGFVLPVAATAGE